VWQKLKRILLRVFARRSASPPTRITGQTPLDKIFEELQAQSEQLVKKNALRR